MRLRFAVAALLLLAFPHAGAAQESAYRFEIASVGDSTFSFSISSSNRWVRRGLRGIAVDPRRRDALVARFEVMRVGRGEAVALITGQTTRLTTDHAVLLERPRPPWYRQRSFWIGTVLGAAIGAALASR